MRTIFVTAALLAAMISGVYAQILKPVKWSFESKKTGDKGYELIFNASIERGWHLYATDLPEGGPIKTSFNIESMEGFEYTSELEANKAPVEKFDDSFQMNLRYYGGNVSFTRKIALKRDKKVEIKGYVEFMACNDETCTPPMEEEFAFTLGKEAVLVMEEEEPVEKPAEDTEKESLWVFFFIALTSGFIGVLTPCVYPMIPMTVTFFMNTSKNKLQAKANALVYGLSIIVIYTFIGVLVSVLFGSDSIKQVSSSWITNTIFFLLFALFAASFFGLFEFVLPTSLTNKSDKQADKGGLIGSFFMALTLVLVSFSCTAPFVGGILVEASTGSIIKPAVGMFGFSLAFALPFTILALFPSWLKKLPKSGGWLNGVKVVLGFVILALGMKFLLVPNQALGWGLTREFFIAVWIVLFTLMGLYLLGKIKFSHDSDINHISVPRLVLIIATFTFVVYLMPGMFGAPLKTISGFLPAESSFNLVEIIEKNRGNTVADDAKSAICEEPKYNDLFKLPHGLQGYFDYEQGVKCAKELNKPILLDFKGHACTNCKVMEKNVWSDPEVLKRLRNDYVIIALYVDERAKLPESEWVTSTFDGKVKKTIGKKNADFQASRFGVNSQPYYVLLDHNGSKLTDPKGFDLNVKNYIDFLDRGIEAFKK